MAKIILSANTDWYIYNFRLALARRILEQGNELIIHSPAGPYVENILAEGFDWRELKVTRHGTRPSRELATFAQIASHYRKERPDLAHHFTIKPVIYGSLSRRLTGSAAIVNSIAGLGYVYLNSGNWMGIARALIKPLYRIALSVPNSMTIFHNPDDLEFFVGERMVHRERAVVISGCRHLRHARRGRPRGRSQPRAELRSEQPGSDRGLVALTPRCSKRYSSGPQSTTT